MEKEKSERRIGEKKWKIKTKRNKMDIEEGWEVGWWWKRNKNKENKSVKDKRYWNEIYYKY